MINDCGLDAFDAAMMLPLLCRALAFGEVQKKIDLLRRDSGSSV
ncbi:hypothetical protein SZ54_5007 [Rhizobium sp. UR51a]|nr:hypothetical protein SZ54_5007 [Rhizobium sp. UR51a]